MKQNNASLWLNLFTDTVSEPLGGANILKSTYYDLQNANFCVSQSEELEKWVKFNSGYRGQYMAKPNKD